MRVRFGATLAAQQMLSQCDWLLFSHLSLAQVQRFVPSVSRRPYAVFLHDIEAWEPLPSARRRVLRNAFVRVANSTYTARRVMNAHPDVGAVLACPLALEPDAQPDDQTSMPPVDIGRHAVLLV